MKTITEREANSRVIVECGSELLTVGMIAASIATYRFKHGGEYVIDEDSLPKIIETIKREITAREWLCSNPITALKALVDSAREFPNIPIELAELDVALYTLADSYTKWADGLPVTIDAANSVPEHELPTTIRENRQRVASARNKANRLRELAKALEASPTL